MFCDTLLPRLEISVEFTKSSVISVDLKNSVNISRSLPVSYYWYLLILSVSFHGSVHVNMNKNPKILIFGHKMSIFKSKMSKISHSYQKFSKFPKSPFSIPKFPKFPFSDLNSHFRIFLFWSENGGFRMKFTDSYWCFDSTDSYWYFDYWYFDFTDSQLLFFKYHWKWYFQPTSCSDLVVDHP